ncbi:MAG TPA: carbamoyltransferase HypF [Candidatus Marinimicrobia bacterium]|nr:carbamoyltransferase HypF [Candidatus Neomarinimicrobiota bacterium]
MKKISKEIIITGIVQGVGFRPFIFNLALKYRLKGYVYNDSSGVKIVVQGDDKRLESFESEIKAHPPSRSKITSYSSAIIASMIDFSDFQIRLSLQQSEKSAAVSPDLDMCPDCLAELFDPKNRRYLYPFINCTNCGPRYTIIQDIPYDRPKTTMSRFQMCLDCQAEYDDPSNRRFHAQPNACPACGPHLELKEKTGKTILTACKSAEYEELFKSLKRLFTDDRIIAIKGVGGYHLACDATSEKVVSALRKRKYREDKPFAVMFPDIHSIKKICRVNKKETELLESVAHPITLLGKKKSYNLAESIAPNNHNLGAMLPYAPLYFLLFRYFKKPLVMTSGNISDEPIAYQDDDAFQRLGSIADYFLTHNREIHIRCDDSVVREFQSKMYPIRRSRGYVPDKLILDWEFNRHILACGPEQKNTFALAKDNAVYLSHHIGDLENLAVLKSFEEGIEHFRNIFDIQPEIVTYDLHPDYLSTKFAHDYSKEHNLRKIGVQHHHAHAVSCMLDNKINKKLLAIVLDGTGYGNDGTIWGGELLLAEYHQFERLGCFKTCQMPGGAAAIKNPWQMGISYLYEVFGEQLADIPFVENFDSEKIDMVLAMLGRNFNSPLTSSCGRLFDGVAAIAGLRNIANYEGQPAVEFEQLIQQPENYAYEFRVVESEKLLILDWSEMIRQLVNDIHADTSINRISLKFHNGLCRGLTMWAEIASAKTGIRDVVLSGGVFMNVYLLRHLKKSLEKKGFNVYTHSVVPCNDGGISLGQVGVANAWLTYGKSAG